ncbi:MAG: phage integrase SAM-like domain-containing protein [Bacteroidota bacterium]
MATIIYRIRGKSSIYISLTIGREIKLETNTGFNVLPKDWSTTTKRPKQNTDSNKKTFGHLSKLETFIYDEVNTAQSKGQLIDVNWLKDKIDICFDRVKKTDQSLLANHIQYIINNANTRKISGSNKLGLSKRRVTGYVSFKNLIEVYEKELKKKIQLQDINKPFVDRFTNWLINKKNYSINYAGKVLDNLKTVCLDAEKLGIKINEYAGKIQGFKEQNEDRYIQTLSFTELEQIRTAEMETPAQDNARKWLLIGCEIGQRAGDLLKLTKDNLRYKGNYIYFDIEQEKTGKDLSIRVIAPHIIDIVENDFPYTISQQKLNKHIKEVCRLAKIVDEVKGKKFDKETKRKKLDFYPKCDLITSHSFRRSFATNYYKKMPTAVLIGITKHSKESLFLEYINRREDKDLNADLFADFYDKMQKDKELELKVIRNASNQ